MGKRKLIIYLLIIAAILVAVFLSQRQTFVGNSIKNVVSDATDKAKAYMTSGADWVMDSIYTKVAGDVQERGEGIKNEFSNITDNAKNISSDATEKIQDYFSGIADSILHPGQDNCQTETIETTETSAD